MIVAAIRRANIPLARLDPQLIGPHHPRYTLVIDEMTPSVKLTGLAPIFIAGQFVPDFLNNRKKFCIAEV